MFRFDDGAEKSFDVSLDPRTLGLIPQAKSSPPEWTKLTCNQCPNCPLDKTSIEHCPVLDKLKPMVRFHLPFANSEETQYRVLSMYLLAQYFVQRHGGTPDWGLAGLSALYHDIQTVNKAFCDRLRTLHGEDAVPNAIVILDTFAMGISFNLDQAILGKTERLFAAYPSK